MLSDGCPVCPVCDVGVLWPNGWMDHDETWHAGRPRPWPHCVRWGPSFPPQKDGKDPLKKGDSRQFSVYVYCGQTTGWIKMPLGTEVGLGSGHIVSDGDPVSPIPERGTVAPTFLLMSIVAKWLDASRCHLVRR